LRATGGTQRKLAFVAFQTSPDPPIPSSSTSFQSTPGSGLSPIRKTGIRTGRKRSMSCGPCGASEPSAIDPVLPVSRLRAWRIVAGTRIK
jgi:hypothetical protein